MLRFAVISGKIAIQMFGDLYLCRAGIFNKLFQSEYMWEPGHASEFVP